MPCDLAPNHAAVQTGRGAQLCRQDQSPRVPSCHQPQTDSAVDLRFLLLTVGLVQACGLRAQEKSHEGSQKDLSKVRQQRIRGPALPGGGGAGGAGVSVTDGGWPAPG